MDKYGDGLEPAHCTRYQDSDRRCLVKGEMITPEDDTSSIKKELNHIVTDDEFEEMPIIEKATEDDKSSIKKELDHIMADDEFDEIAIKEEVGDSLLNIKEEVDPLSIEDFSETGNAILQLVPTLQKNGQTILPHDSVSCLQPMDTAKVPIPLNLLARNNFNQIYKGRQLYIHVKKSLACNYKAAVGNKRAYQLQCTKQAVNQAFSHINSGNIGFTQQTEVGHFRAAVNNYKKALVYYIKPSVNKLITADSQSDICYQSNKHYKYNGNINKEDGCYNIKTSNDITKTGSILLSREKVTVSDDLQNHFANDKHLSDSGGDRNVNNEDNSQSVILCNRKNVESLKTQIGQRFIKLLCNSTSVQSTSTFLPQLNCRRKKYYYCPLCKKRFHGRNKLKIHEESKCGSLKLFDCHICAKGFANKSYVKHHIKVAHNVVQNPKFKCEECNIFFNHKSTFYRHNKVKHQLQIKNKSSLYKENTTKHQEEECQPQTCEYCQKSYFSVKSLKSHISLKHRLDSEPFECAHCMKQYPSKTNLITHIRRSHMPDQIKCTLCKSFFASQENLERHLKDMHKEETKYVCDVCGKGLRTKHILTYHLRTHTGEKPFMCQTCGKCFKTEPNLNQHSVIHSEARPYGCDQCSKSFRIRNHLRQHMAVHGLNNTSVKFRKLRKK